VSPDELRRAARAVFDAGLAAADAGALVRAELGPRPAPPPGRVLVLGAGKASGAMAAAAEEAWGAAIRGGLVAVKDGHGAPTRRVRVVEAGHPVPDARGAAAAQEIAALARAAGPGDLVLVLLSGGASALLPAPAPPVSLEDKRELTRILLEAGATIGQLNCVRKHCSLLKGGQLARLAAPAPALSLVLSDVIGDPLDVIGSGPTAPDASTYSQAMGILARLDVRDRVPPSVLARLHQGMRGEAEETPKPGDPVFDRVRHAVIGNNLLVVEAAAARARALGLATAILDTGLEGEARVAGRELARTALDAQRGRGPARPPCCLIASGETTVTVRGRGRGGRCQELALAAALELADRPGIALLAAGTDGTDGPTEAAGALVDAGTVARARGRGLDPAARLDDNDANPVLAATGDLVITGPTNTNLLDLYLLVVDAEAS
jgi:hydroxypyruvate reductase